MTWSRTARAGSIAAIALLALGLVFVGNQRQAQAESLAQQIVCRVFNDLHIVSQSSPVPFPPFRPGCAHRGGLLVTKIVNGGTASSGSFQIHIKSGGADIEGSPQAGVATGRGYGNLPVGTYAVSESGGPAGYTASFSGGCGANGSVTVTAGNLSTCTITNTFTGEVTPPPPPPPLPQCSDGIDNDGDGRIDAADPACHTDGKANNPDSYDPNLGDESLHIPQCRDGIDNDGDGHIDFPNDPDCTSEDDDRESPSGNGGNGEVPGEEEEESPPPPPPSSGGTSPAPSSGGGGGGSAIATQINSALAAEGQVLGAQAYGPSCEKYLTEFIRSGRNNTLEQVRRLQTVLRDFEGANIAVNGVYDAATLAAVHAFQTKYASEILSPWGIARSTGFVYLTTRKKVNEIYCRNTMQFPLTNTEKQIIERVRVSARPSSAAPSAPAAPRAPSAPSSAEAESPTTGAAVQPSAILEAITGESSGWWERLKSWFGAQAPSEEETQE